jgi:hypothetical protein
VIYPEREDKPDASFGYDGGQGNNFSFSRSGGVDAKVISCNAASNLRQRMILYYCFISLIAITESVSYNRSTHMLSAVAEPDSHGSGLSKTFRVYRQLHTSGSVVSLALGSFDSCNGMLILY